MPVLAVEPTVLKAYRSEKLPTIDGTISDGEWTDTPLYKESVSKSSVAFKHDGENLYVLAIYEDKTPSPKDYFGMEFDQNGDMEHMGTAEQPDYSIFVSGSIGGVQAREALLPGPAKPLYFEDLNLVSKVQAKIVNNEGRYVVELKRPFKTDSEAMFQVGQTIGIGFATGEFGKGTAHRATDMASYALMIVPDAYQGGEMGADFDIYGTTADYGPYIQYAALTVVVLHLVRRKVWAPSERTVWVTVERHVRSARVAHWLRVSTLITLVATGWTVLLGQPVLGAATSLVHVVVGFVVLLAELPLHIFAVLRKGEHKHLLRLDRDDLKVCIMIAKNFFGLTSEYPPHAVYDASANDYYMGRKYCSFQKFLVWGYFLTLGGLGLTGFAMWYPRTLPWVFDLLGGGVSVRGIHLLLFYVFTSLFLGHIYLSLIPVNWKRLRAMVAGSCKIPLYSSTGKTSQSS